MTSEAPGTITPLRPPARIMRLDRLGALQPSRLSFSRQFLRRMAAERWAITRPTWAIDRHGSGHAVYAVSTGGHAYAILARATADGVSLILCDALPAGADIARLCAILSDPGGPRLSERELCLTHARRVDGVWDHAVARLAAGLQPDAARLAAAGALLHSQPVHASGAFGTADRALICDRPEMHAPFQAELLTLFAMRLFARDMVDHLARAAGGAGAARLQGGTAAALGIGLSAGLGLAAFPVAHPCLFNTWIMAREEAIARVLALPAAGATNLAADWDDVRRDLMRRAAGMAAGPAADLRLLVARMGPGPAGDQPWRRIMDWADDTLGPAAQEAFASALLEPYGDLVDGLGQCMSDTLDDDFRLDGSVGVGRVRALIAAVHGWALNLDWAGATATALAWSATQDDINPRLGPRDPEQTAPFELPLAVVRDAVRAWRTLGTYPDELAVAHVLRDHPDHRSAIRRAQITGFAPYAEIRDNLIGAEIMPGDLLRATLSFLGAEAVDPSTEGLPRARIFAGAPCPRTGP